METTNNNQLVDVQLPTEVVNTIINGLKEDLNALKEKESQINLAIRNLETGKPINSGMIVTMNANRKVTHSNGNTTGKKNGARNKLPMRHGLLDRIKDVVRKSKNPLTSRQVAEILFSVYGYDKLNGKEKKKAFDSLDSSISAMMNQYREGSGSGLIPTFERTAGPTGAWIYKLKQGV